MAVLSPERFAERFGGLLGARTFRLELLDSYVAATEQGPFERFRAGLPNDPVWREPWKQFVRQARAAGKTMERVHVFTEPLTAYARFELTWVYPANVAAGEDVRVLPRGGAKALDLPPWDFWLFDEDVAAVMQYDDQGNWLSVELTDDPETVDQCASGRDVALRHAMPLYTYLAEHNLEEQYERRSA